MMQAIPAREKNLHARSRPDCHSSCFGSHYGIFANAPAEAAEENEQKKT